ncbi:hypothetical protein HK104_000207 [Borealophlyctis nickersoniae]|nr:hypothetical protein HK104_000207 [Borealophlyctis nickersoniae]
MATVNIRRDVSDKFYRYKMPKLLAKVEGKGNGIKTVIPNMSEIAKSLSRPATYPTKFFGCELGALVKCDEKTDRYIVNGAHDAEKLAGLLDAFIDKFVLCPSCRNPETDLTITKNEMIMRNCKACGAVEPVDMHHKLSTFVLKNPPVQTKKSKKDKKTKGEGSPSGGEKSGMPTPPETASNGSGEDDDDELTRRIEAEAALHPQATQEDGDDDWAVDTSPEAVAARMKELSVSGAVAKLAEMEEDEEEGDDPLELFADFLSNNPTATDSQIIQEAGKLDLRSDKVCAVLPQVIFDAQILSAKQVQQRATLLKEFVKNEKCQKALLGGVERLVGVKHKELLPKVAMILKTLYDAELIDEEVLIAWGDKASKKYVDRKTAKEIRDKAGPFLTWLKEAEEEDSDEDDEE